MEVLFTVVPLFFSHRYTTDKKEIFTNFDKRTL